MPSYDLCIKNARVAQADGSIEEADVACRAGRIDKIAPSIAASAQESIDARGMLLLPGVIDPQVHFRDPGAPHKEDLASGSRAAVKGGVTSFLDMPNTSPNTIDQASLDAKIAVAAKKSVANFGFFIGATPHNLEHLNIVNPVCGIKVFMGSSTGNLLVDDPRVLDKIFAHGRRLIAVHAENEDRIQRRMKEYLSRASEGELDVALHSQIRDTQCAVLATKQALALSEKYQRRLHILHLSTGTEAQILRDRKPAWVTAEVLPNHLFLNTDDYADLGSLVQMNPPIRGSEDNAVLWQALRDGVLDFIATDHAPHTLDEKHQPYPKSPSGMPGVETSLPLMLTAMKAGHCTLAQLQKWMSSGPARAYGIDNKGVIAEGWDADLTIVDVESRRPVRDEEMFTKAGWSPYRGRNLTGWPTHTIVNGRVVFEQGNIRTGIMGKVLQFTPDEE